ncbi:hypothetical protein DWF00_09570 [Bosea caraganae]|uniref:Uncharacterized protein n=1 Tax=Bosea caraganae TaxID=2763117 RepID=A0A370LB96_9HYPH|nr:hypothetical protein [Bosea caraganae]RDJ27231.1 hypothetical protein DWF00_09570 [Bosea caraganae]RDJ29247.1 hypothetical protein DWE98_01340 [Bosea caraganae]
MTAAPAQQRPPAPPPGPALSASGSTMAGSMLSVIVNQAPPTSFVAVAKPTDAPETAMVSVPVGAGSTASITTPGETGTYELRLLRENDGKSEILARQSLVTMPATATLAAPERVKRGVSFPARGIGPNGGHDRVVITEPGAPVEAEGPSFFPAENVEATLEAPEKSGTYELRYVMNAPLSGQRILARRPLLVD